MAAKLCYLPNHLNDTTTRLTPLPRFCSQQLRRIFPQKLPAVIIASTQPILVLIVWQYHHHTLLIGRLVEKLHERVRVSVYGQHGVAAKNVTAWGFPACP